MTDRQKKVRIKEILEALRILYPEAVCALTWRENEQQGTDTVQKNGWRLLVMGRLSAQCTDARVNLVCRDLFAKYPTCRALADAPLPDIEAIIRPCGLYHTKAESIKAACGILCARYDGKVPDSMEELLTLPGVGRKIANLLLGDLYGQPAVVADTHFIRLCGRWGMYPASLKDPAAIERMMRNLLPPEESSDFCHRVVQFGRDVCSARHPACDRCPVRTLCSYVGSEAASKSEDGRKNEEKH